MKDDNFAGLNTPVVSLDDDRPDKVYVTHHDIWLHGFVIMLAIGAALFALTTLLGNIPCHIRLAGRTLSLVELRLIGLVITAGALGGLVHTATSFATFAGNRQLLQSWLIWFYVRPAVGAILAVILYAAFRSDALGPIAIRKCKDVYQIIFVAGIAGLFSKQIADKLSELVDTLFRTAEASKRADPPRPEDGTGATTTVAGAVTTDVQIEAPILRVQKLLIGKKYLLDPLPNGAPADSGILDDYTREAINKFLDAAKMSNAERESLLKHEAAPEYWTRLATLLEQS